MIPDDDPVGLKHVGANSVTSVTAYVILYPYIQVHTLVQIKSPYHLSEINSTNGGFCP